MILRPLLAVNSLRLRMAAEIVVVLEDEDLGLAARLLAIEESRRKPGDAAADHHEIVGFTGRFRRAGACPRRCRRAPNA